MRRQYSCSKTTDRGQIIFNKDNSNMDNENIVLKYATQFDELGNGQRAEATERNRREASV